MEYILIYMLIAVGACLVLVGWHQATGKGTSDYYGKKEDDAE